MMEYLTQEEQRQLNDLLAKQKRIQREEKKEKEFWENVDRRKEEILKHFNISKGVQGNSPMP